MNPNLTWVNCQICAGRGVVSQHWPTGTQLCKSCAAAVEADSSLLSAAETASKAAFAAALRERICMPAEQEKPA